VYYREIIVLLLLTGCGKHYVVYDRSFDNKWAGFSAGVVHKDFVHQFSAKATGKIEIGSADNYRYAVSYDASYRFYNVEYHGLWFEIMGGMGIDLRVGVSMMKHNVITAEISYPDDIDSRVRPYITTVLMGGYKYLMIQARVHSTWDEIYPTWSAGLRF
tara:strand:- start:5385 stop:5861 length:477 start_codon:yes stop_codon:yes gene_type:complete